MSPRFSHYLDSVRFIAAFVVLLSHFAYQRFTQGQYQFIRDYNLGSDAVVLFFVLSGFVISFAATQKDKSLERFSFSRLTRLYSVAIPALLLTVLCDLIGRKFSPEFYHNSVFYNPLNWDVFWGRGLTFSNFWFGDSIRLGSNGPFWSLSYEAAYYCLFAILMFTTGLTRILATLLCLIIFGLKILLLAPAWFFGVAAYFLLQNYDFKKVTHATKIAMIALPIIIYIYMLAIGVAPVLRQLTYLLMGEERFYSLAFSDEFLWNALVGLLFTIHLIGTYLLFSEKTTRPKSGPLIKWLAGASFSIYLVHYPVLQFLGAILPRSETAILNHIVLLVLTCVVCFIFASLFERPLYALRNLLRPSWKKLHNVIMSFPVKATIK